MVDKKEWESYWYEYSKLKSYKALTFPGWISDELVFFISLFAQDNYYHSFADRGSEIA